MSKIDKPTPIGPAVRAKFFLSDPRSTGGPPQPRRPDVNALKGTKTR